MDPAGHSLSVIIYHWVVLISNFHWIINTHSTVSEMCLQPYQCMLILCFIYIISFNVCNVIYTNNSSRALSQPQCYALLRTCSEEFLHAKLNSIFVLELLLLMLSFHHQFPYIAKYTSLRIFGRAVHYAFLSTE